MAKQEKDFTVAEKLANLYKLQVYVTEIDRIKSLRGELPQEVEDMEAEIAGMETSLAKLQDDRTQAEHKIRLFEGKMAEAKTLINQYTEQQEQVQNNKQYEFLLKEIEYQGLEIELATKRINESKSVIEIIDSKIAATTAARDERISDLDIKKGELDEIIAETRNEEETLREKAKKIETAVDPQLLASFRRVHKKAKNGLAIVPIEREACSGCNNKITPQRQIDVKMRKHIIACEYCGRILIDEELANENAPRRRRKDSVANLQ